MKLPDPNREVGGDGGDGSDIYLSILAISTLGSVCSKPLGALLSFVVLL
jgi:hypothetical protein